MSTIITYNGEDVARLTNKSIVLNTSSKWLTNDIDIVSNDDGYPIKQDEANYIVFDDTISSHTKDIVLNATSNNTYTATAGQAYSKIKVNVPYSNFLKSLITRDIEYITASDCMNIDSVKENFFKKCTSLKSVSMPNVTFLGKYAFDSCSSLEDVDLPSVTNIAGIQEFYACSSLVTLYLPRLTLGTLNYFARYCSSLVSVVLPSFVGSITNYAFSNCPSLKNVDIRGGKNIAANNGFNTSALDTLVLRRTDSICALGGINPFNNTPFASGGTGGTLYVPATLKETYESATNWSTILGYENNSIATIEGSPYEHYYVDGTAIE